jgi:serine/threonine-protein kinase
MGTVWVARHVELDVDVAIKFRASPDELDASAVDRFKREAQAAARLKSPHVVHIYDYGVDEGVPYIAMELLEGEDLGDLLDRVDYLPLERTAELVDQAARGLECAHEAHIVHRDIKPRNLFLARQRADEVLKILDFGIAKRKRGAGDDGNTSANVILGSPNYMSPEQARGAELDASSDVWSLAAVAYRALTGVPPFVGQNSQDTVIKICTERAPDPTEHRADLPRAVDSLFERALARNPEERFASPSEFAGALAELAKQHPDEAGRAGTPATRTQKGRSDPTETLASPAGESLEDSAPNKKRLESILFF